MSLGSAPGRPAMAEKYCGQVSSLRVSWHDDGHEPEADSADVQRISGTVGGSCPQDSGDGAQPAAVYLPVQAPSPEAKEHQRAKTAPRTPAREHKSSEAEERKWPEARPRTSARRGKRRHPTTATKRTATVEAGRCKLSQGSHREAEKGATQGRRRSQGTAQGERAVEVVAR